MTSGPERGGISERILEALLRGKNGTVGVFVHDYPDPDALASAMAFTTLCKAHDLESRIYYSGDITHQENRTFVEQMGLSLDRLEGPEDAARVLEGLSVSVLVDASVPSENNVLPKDAVPDIVVDHHASGGLKSPARVAYLDAVGATSTLMTILLMDLSITPARDLATALTFGIRTDTHRFLKSMTDLDMKAVAHLNPLSDNDILERLEETPMSGATMDVFGRALRARTVEGGLSFAYIGTIPERDALPQVADFLMREEGVMASAACAVVEDALHMSARCRADADLGAILKDILGRMGSAGGHPHSAGARLPLEPLDITDPGGEAARASVEQRVRLPLLGALQNALGPQRDPRPGGAR